MKQAWNAFGTPEAINWTVLLLVGVQVFFGSLAAPFIDIEGRVIPFLGVRLASIVTMWGVLLVGKGLLRAAARERPQPILTLAIFVTAMSALSISMNYFLILTELTTVWNLPQRLLTSIPGVLSLLVFTTLLVAFAKAATRNNAELATAAAELINTKAETGDRIAARKNELMATVHEELYSALENLSPSQTQLSASALKTMVDDVVRPLSYQLSREVQIEPARTILADNSKIHWADLFNATMRGNPNHPVATTLWLGFLLAGFLVPLFGLTGIATVALSCITVLAIVGSLRWYWKRLPPTLPVWAAAAFYTAAIFLYVILTSVSMTQLTGYSFLKPHTFVGWTALSLFISWTISLVFAVNAQLREINLQLSRAVEELKREVVNLNNELRALQKRVSRVLHGPVQQAITASLVKLNTVSQQPRNSDALLELRHRISSALELVDTPMKSSLSLSEALDDMVELWDEVVTISITAADSDLDRVESDPAAKHALLELTREAIGNAVRHGDARNISLVVSVPDDRLSVNIVVINDGKPLKGNTQAGLGTQMLDEMCLNWSRFQSGSSITLRASIPLGL